VGWVNCLLLHSSVTASLIVRFTYYILLIFKSFNKKRKLYLLFSISCFSLFQAKVEKHLSESESRADKLKDEVDILKKDNATLKVCVG